MEKSFSSKIGVLLAAAGSAVGLGSIWKFPYVVGENGGGAFIILYIVCALVFGLPLVMNEFLIGKLSGRSAYGAFRALTGSNRWQWLSWIFFDVNKGIERLSKILMPILFLFLIIMAAHMLIIDGGTTGLRYLFMPDFSKITSKVILEAMGLSFFTLSVGMGILVTYGGYMPKEQNVTTTSVQMIVLVIIVSLLSGMIVFPAVFAYGFSPSEGPELTFVTLPAVFQQMFSPTLTSVTFFGLMCVAALTSTISLMEVVVAFICEATSNTKRPFNRHQSAVVAALILVFTNTLIVLSMTGHADWLTVMGQNLFNSFNILSTNILIPIGALGTALFSGWFVPKARYQGSRVGSFLYLIVLRWLVPIAILIIFLNSVNII